MLLLQGAPQKNPKFVIMNFIEGDAAGQEGVAPSRRKKKL